jgi:hypothetical protein
MIKCIYLYRMKRALLIGINYIHSPDNVKLSGCIDDALSMKRTYCGL